MDPRSSWNPPCPFRQDAGSVEKLCGAFAKLEKFDAASIEAALKSTAAELGVKVGVLVHPVRLACTGNPNGPSLYHLLEVVGKERALARLQQALGLMT